jgi:hypothetical protein
MKQKATKDTKGSILASPDCFLRCLRLLLFQSLSGAAMTRNAAMEAPLETSSIRVSSVLQTLNFLAAREDFRIGETADFADSADEE